MCYVTWVATYLNWTHNFFQNFKLTRVDVIFTIQIVCSGFESHSGVITRDMVMLRQTKTTEWRLKEGKEHFPPAHRKYYRKFWVTKKSSDGSTARS